MGSLKSFARVVRDGRLWRREHLRLALRGVHHRRYNIDRGYTDQEHLRAAAGWLRAAQDASGDGGVAGRYALDRGWSSSYPETTGYILPTFLALATVQEADDHRDRARRCLDFLLSVQLESGAFPGGEIAENRTKPSLFNTAQILNGLTAWHRATGDDAALAAARRAADWIVAVQDPDGAFRRHCYNDLATTYATHASCWVAEFGEHTGDDRYLGAAGRHLDWALAHADPETGWLDCCGFSAQDHQARTAFTHTIAYSLWGVLYTSAVLGRRDGLEVVRRAAEGIARRLELSRRLPGVLDHQWRPRSGDVCLTGNAQMALVWLRLHELESNPRFLNAALRAIDGVKEAQVLESSDTGIRGGIPGSDPVWGGYLSNALPNWAAKFFIDALLAKQRALGLLRSDPSRAGTSVPPPALPSQLPAADRAPDRQLKVLLYTTAESRKPANLLAALGSTGACSLVIVIVSPPEPSAARRVARKFREEGFASLLRKLMPGGAVVPEAHPEIPGDHVEDPLVLATRLGLPIIQVDSLNSTAGLQAIRALEPDLAIHAGAGILRPPVLQIPRLGTVNAHMGLLPYYRGMNVSEWAALSGDPVGCTVHLVDAGIDTGPILAARAVDTVTARSIAQLRHLVDQAQILLLAEVLRSVIDSGELPLPRHQRPEEGVQFFRMHDDLKHVLEQRLAGFLP